MSTLEQPAFGAGRGLTAVAALDERVIRLLPVELEVLAAHEDHQTVAERLPAIAELNRREATYRRALAVADAIASILGVLMTAFAFADRPNWLVLLVPLIAVSVAKIEGLYDRDDQVIVKSNLPEWRTVLQSNLITGIVLYLAWTVLTGANGDGGMRHFLFLVFATFWCTIAGRGVARRIARERSPHERCVIIGDRRRVDGVAHRLLDVPGVELVGLLSEDALSGSVQELAAVVGELGLHRLVIADAHEPDERTLDLIQAAKFLGVRVSLVPSVMTAVGGFALIEELDGLTLLGVPSFGLSRSSVVLKRVFDLVVGSLSLILFAPLLAAIALAIRFDSPGPALFRQTRIGRGGRPFTILKFRSMVDGADRLKAELLARNEAGDGLFKIVGDPRITRVGRFIRATHLDELPQLINVLRGEMSLVGPRPLVLEEDERVIGRDRHRSQLTPGITGPWQVKGPLAVPLSEMAKLDYRYASSWSIWTDLDILIQTVLRVLNRGGE